MCPKRICHNLVMSNSENDIEIVITSIIEDPYKIYKLLDLQAFITIRACWVTFKAPPSVVYLNPKTLKMPKEMRFPFRSRTCLTSMSVLTIPSCILIRTVPLLITLQISYCPLKQFHYQLIHKLKTNPY